MIAQLETGCEMARVYISSTFEDLRVYRQAVHLALQRLGHDVEWMEAYVAADERPLDACLKDVIACDVYVGIVAWRYGYVPCRDNPDGLSITELELRTAEQNGKPRLIFLLKDDVPWPPKFVDTDAPRYRLNMLRADLAANRLASFFSNEHELAELVATAITRWEKRQRQQDDRAEQRTGFRRPERRPFQAPAVPGAYLRRPMADVVVSNLVDTTHPLLMVHGLPGVGKTLLACDVANNDSVRERFPDGVLWATLGQTPDRLSLLVSWIQALEQQPYTPSSEAAATGFLRALLAERRMLVVIDDAWTPDDARPFMVAGQLCGTLITSRRAAVSDQLSAQTVDLGVFSPDEARQFFATQLKSDRHIQQTGLAALAAAVGYHPMALDLLAAMLRRGFSSDLARRRLLPSEDPKPLTGEASPIQRCIALSVDWLRERDHRSWEAFTDLSILVEDASIDALLAARLWSVDPEEAEQRLSILGDDSLLIRRPSGYVMHDLVRDVGARVLQAPVPFGRGTTLASRNVAFLQTYGNALTTAQWYVVDYDGYIHRNLSRHLIAAGREDCLHQLLGQFDSEGLNGWYEFHRRHGALAFFLDDVKLALDICRRSDPDKIGLQLRYVLIQATFGSLFGKMSPRVPSILFRRGFWSLERASDFAAKLGAPRSKVQGAAHLLRATVAPGAATEPSSSEVVQALTRALVDGARAWTKAEHHSALLIASCLQRVDSSAAAELLEAVLRVAAVGDERDTAAASDAVRALACMAFVTAGPFRTRLIDAAAWLAFKLDLDNTVRALDYLLPACTTEEANRIVAAFFSSMDRSPFRESGRVTEAEPTRREPSKSPPGVETDSGGGKRDLGARVSELLGRRRRDESLALVRTISDSPPRPEGNERIDALAADRSRTRLPVGNQLETISRWACEFPADDWQSLLAMQPREARVKLIEARVGVQQRPRAAPNVSSILRSRIQFATLYTLADVEYLADLLELCETESLRPQIGTELHEVGTSAFTADPAVPLRLLTLTDDPVGIARALQHRLAEPSMWLDAIQTVYSADERRLSPVIDQLSSTENYDANRVIAERVCAVASEKLVDRVLLLSRIRDGAEQAGAVLSLSPYARFDLVAAAMPKMTGRIGRQTEVLTRLVGELSSRLRGEALVEFIEAASRFQSEWWIVEALTILCWQRADIEDLQSIAKAARHFRAADLRARLSDRVTARLVGLGHFEAAARVADDIEIDMDRWRTLADISASASAAGLFRFAEDIAFRIDERHERSRALRELAFGYARRNRLADANAIEIPDPDTRAWVSACLKVAAPNAPSVSAMPAPQQTMRKEVDVWRQSVGFAIDSVVARHESWHELIELRKQSGLAQEQVDFAARVWNSRIDTGELLFEALAGRDRPRVLNLIRDLAPVLAWQRESDADEMVRAIGSVCAWWP